MPDWGTLIADSRGILHDVAKNSFDSLTKDIRQPLNPTQKLLSESFTTTFDQFKKRMGEKFNVDVSHGVTLESVSSQIGAQLKNTATRMGVEAAVGLVAAKVATLEGPVGLILSEAVTIATGEFANYFASKQDFKPGQWVFIDVGEKTRHVNENPKVIELREDSDIFGDQGFAVIPDDLDYSTEAQHTIGFVLGQETAGDFLWNVFSFKSGQEERIHNEKLRPCPEAYATTLDDNPDFSSVREVLFMKDHDPTLKTYIPTEPGEVVWLDKKPCTIIEQAGKEWVVETRTGKHIHVSEGDLLAGKTLSNTRWNHDTMHLGSFTSRSPDALYSGEWVWIPAGDLIKKIIGKRRRMGSVPAILQKMRPENQVLALVKSIEGETVHLVRAFDGEPIDLPQKEVKGSSSAIESSLDHDKELMQWKEDTLDTDKNPKFHPPGSIHPMLALGLGELDDEELRNIEMQPSTVKALPDALEQIASPINVFDSATDKVAKRDLTHVEDENEQLQNFFDTRGDFKAGLVEVGQNPDTVGGGGSGAMVMLMIGGVVLYVALSGA